MAGKRSADYGGRKLKVKAGFAVAGMYEGAKTAVLAGSAGG